MINPDSVVLHGMLAVLYRNVAVSIEELTATCEQVPLFMPPKN